MERAQVPLNGDTRAVSTSLFGPAEGARPAIEQATIGRSLVIKGEISGVEALYIDGRVEGAVTVPEHRVTIGPTGNVISDIRAQDVVIMGTVKGNILCGDRADIRSGSSITGEIVAHRVVIQEGAMIKGSVEVRQADKGLVAERRPGKAKNDAMTAPVELGPLMPATSQKDHGVSVTQVSGSSVLLKEVE